MRYLLAKCTEIGSRMVVSKGQDEREMVSHYLMDAISVWDDGKGLGMDSGNGCMIL